MTMWGTVRGFIRWLAYGQKTDRRPDPLRLAAQRPAQPVAAAAPARQTGVEPAPESPQAAEKRQRKLRARTSHAFAPSQPVDSREDLCGRERELERLLTALCDSHLHGIIFGPRGSGKTSLARVFGDHADERGFTVIYLSCTGGENFSDLMIAYVEDLGAQSFGMSDEEFSEVLDASNRYSLTPRSLATLLARVTSEPVIFILDEFDRVADPALKQEMASFTKLLSDMRSNVRLLFVGISGDIDDLIGAHQSVRRHLVAVGVIPLVEEAVDRFIRSASHVSGLTFDDEARKTVSHAAQGSPYHVRLFCLHGAMAALDQHRVAVSGDDVITGMKAAQEDWRMTNQRDATLFERVVADDLIDDGLLVTLVRTAARYPEFQEDDFIAHAVDAGYSAQQAAHVLEVLAGALTRLPGAQPVYCFNDALAPQFLLTSRITSRGLDQTTPRNLAGSLK